MDIKRVTCFSIVTSDKAGELARVTSTLMQANVAMEGIWGFSLGQGKARIIGIPRDLVKFKEVAKTALWQLEEDVCFRITGEDRTGALVDILDLIAREKINLHAVDAMSLDSRFVCYLWAADEQVEIIAQVLGLSTPRL